MPAAYDFTDGSISSNIINALMDCSAHDIVRLARTDKLKFYKASYGLTYKNLCAHALDEYARVSGYSVRYFLYGSDEQPLTYYTKADNLVIRALNSLDEEHLRLLKKAVFDFYYSPIMDPDPSLGTPSKRLIAVIKSRKKSCLLESIPEEERYKYRERVDLEILRYKKNGYTPLFRFNSEYILDVSTMVGVSVRWIMGIHDNPLFCDSAVADDVFDLFTLMSATNKIAFVGLLSRLSKIDIPELEQIFIEGKGL